MVDDKCGLRTLCNARSRGVLTRLKKVGIAGDSFGQQPFGHTSNRTGLTPPAGPVVASRIMERLVGARLCTVVGWGE